MGESRRKALAARHGSGDEPAEPQVVDTLGGRMHPKFDMALPNSPLQTGKKFMSDKNLAAGSLEDSRSPVVARLLNDVVH